MNNKYNFSDQYFENLGFRESSGNYKAKNSIGYLGKYQMGEHAMIDAGYYKKSQNVGNNDWSGQFTGKDGVYSVQDFLNNVQAQENAVREYTEKQWNYIKKYAIPKEGKIINGIKMTQSGMLAACHLVGQKALIDYLTSNGKIIKTDQYGTNIEEYLKKFADYNVMDITKTPPPVDLDMIYKNIMFPLHKYGYPTGFASNTNMIELTNILLQYLPQSEQQSVQYPSNLSGYTNPLTGNNRIFTREEIGQMSTDEYSRYDKEIMAQLKSIGIPTNSDLQKEFQNGGGVVYVNSYMRSDGTIVKGYYRSKPKY